MQSNALLYCAIMLSFAVSALLIFLGFSQFATKKKLRKHTEEWEQRKAECIKNIDTIICTSHPNLVRYKVEEEYHDYLMELMATESNTLIGCCFPPLGKIEREKNAD